MMAAAAAAARDATRLEMLVCFFLFCFYYTNVFLDLLNALKWRWADGSNSSSSSRRNTSRAAGMFSIFLYTYTFFRSTLTCRNGDGSSSSSSSRRSTSRGVGMFFLFCFYYTNLFLDLLNALKWRWADGYYVNKFIDYHTNEIAF